MFEVEKRRSDVPGLPPGWTKEEIVRKSGLSAGKTDTYYFSPDGRKIRSKPQLARALGDGFDLSSFDFRTGKILQSAVRKSRRLKGSTYDYARGIRHDANLVLPIRQTASIFKQPVTVVKNRPESKTRSDLKHGPQDPPRQLFWEKRLQGLSACDTTEEKFKPLELPHGIVGAGPDLSTENLLQSIAAALHLSSQPITGQSASKTALMKNPGININVEQPLIQQVHISDSDIQKQETRVLEARKRLQLAMTRPSPPGQGSEGPAETPAPLVAPPLAPLVAPPVASPVAPPVAPLVAPPVAPLVAPPVAPTVATPMATE